MKEEPSREPPRPPEPATGLALGVRCTFCHDALSRAEAVYCASCLAPHHAGCFGEHGRCSAPGCAETASVRRGERSRRAGAPLWSWALVLVLLGGVAALWREAMRAPTAQEAWRALGVSSRGDDPCAIEVYVVIEAGGVEMPMRAGDCAGVMIDPSGDQTTVRTVHVCADHPPLSGEDGLPVVIAPAGERVVMRHGARRVDVTPRDGVAVWIVADPATGGPSVSRGVNAPVWPPVPARAP